MSKHTPGPWYWEESENSWQLFGGDMGGHPYQLIKAPKHGTPYAEYWPNEADANLIAAAPALLEALEEIYQAADKWRDNHGASWCREIATAAIASAKGE